MGDRTPQTPPVWVLPMGCSSSRTASAWVLSMECSHLGMYCFSTSLLQSHRFRQKTCSTVGPSPQGHRSSQGFPKGHSFLQSTSTCSDVRSSTVWRRLCLNQSAHSNFFLVTNLSYPNMYTIHCQYHLPVKHRTRDNRLILFSQALCRGWFSSAILTSLRSPLEYILVHWSASKLASCLFSDCYF